MVQEAGLISFLRTLAIILLVFYGIRLLLRYLAPFLLKMFINKQRKAYENATQPNRGETKDGEVHIKASRKAHRQDDESLGDYVDYEEIEESEEKK
jgi:hypothetical protein